MDNAQIEKKAKTGSKKCGGYTSLRVRSETKRKIDSDLAKVNKKDFGRRVRSEDYLALATSLITPQHIEQLQESSLTNSDRLERDCRAYAAKNGTISRDEYLGKLLSGEIRPNSNQEPKRKGILADTGSIPCEQRSERV